MRLSKHITEASEPTIYEALVKLYTKSMPFIKDYIKEMKPNPESFVFYSGRKNKTNPVFEKDIRTDRWSIDTPDDVTDFVDDLFYKKFKVRPRRGGVFTTGRYTMAHGYGHVFGLFPQGKYKFIWSPKIADFFMNVVESDNIISLDPSDFAWPGNYEWNAKKELSTEFANITDREKFDSESQYETEKEKFVDKFLDDRMVDMATKEGEDSVLNVKYLLNRYIDTYTDKGMRQALNSGHEIMMVAKTYTAIRDDYLPYIRAYMEQYGTKKPTVESVKNMNTNFVSQFPDRVLV